MPQAPERPEREVINLTNRIENHVNQLRDVNHRVERLKHRITEEPQEIARDDQKAESVKRPQSPLMASLRLIDEQLEKEIAALNDKLEQIDQYI
jgi:chromosome segregation ATPase